MASRRTVRVREGERREDAAYDLLIPMGFTKKAIQKKIRELLKVYGGPDCWTFIEEGSYRLLIEQLLGEDCTKPTVKNQAIANEEHVDSCSSAVGELVVPDQVSYTSSNNVAAVPTRKRRRYHGWLDSTEDDDEVIMLSPAMFPARINATTTNLYSCGKCRRTAKGKGRVEGERFPRNFRS